MHVVSRVKAMPSVLCDGREQLSELLELLGFGPVQWDSTKYQTWSAWQDWDLVLANAHRIPEFMAVYRHSKLTAPQKIALGALILASLERAFEEPETMPEQLSGDVGKLFAAERSLHKETLEYWTEIGGPVGSFASSIQNADKRG